MWGSIPLHHMDGSESNNTLLHLPLPGIFSKAGIKGHPLIDQKSHHNGKYKNRNISNNLYHGGGDQQHRHRQCRQGHRKNAHSFQLAIIDIEG